MKKIILSTITAVVLGLGAITPASAASYIDTDTVNEDWGKPTLVYGGGLSDTQVESVNSLFHITNLDNVVRLVVKGPDVDKYLNRVDVDTSSLFSSVLVQKKDDGNGVNVSILTPENITLITETQYANAAITAGAADVDIEVVSPIQVTGESALAGVYVALEANGETVDPERTEAAQQELETVNQISQEQAQNEEFDSTQFDLAIAQIKEDLAQFKEEHGEIASVEDILSIIQNVLSEYHLENVLTEEQISQLVEFAQSYQNTSAIDSKEVLEQLNSFSNQTLEQMSDQVRNMEESGFIDRVLKFFSDLWSGITGK